MQRSCRSQRPACWGSSQAGPVKGRAPVQPLREKRQAHAPAEGSFWGCVRVQGRAGSAEILGEEFWSQEPAGRRQAEVKKERRRPWRRQTTCPLLQCWAWPPLHLLAFTVFLSDSLVSQGKNWSLKCVQFGFFIRKLPSNLV